VNAPLKTNRQDFLTQTAFSEGRLLLPHQIEQAIFAVERARSINASETGTGKFLVALAMRLLIEHEAGHKVKCLYTCPKSALGQFEKEFIDHGYRTFVLRHGNDVIPGDVDTVLVANSTMLVTHRDQLRNWCPLLVVLDEAAAFKTATAARTKAVYGDTLDGVGGIIDEVLFVLAMSGTLAPAHNGELYPHLRALAPAALDDHGRIMRRHIFEKTFCIFDARRVAGGREVQVIVGSRNSDLLRKRIDPYVTRVTLREIAPTLPPERHELVPIAREDVKLDELAAIADIEDAEIRIAIEALAAAIRDGFVPAPDIDREMTRLMEMVGGGTALAHLRRAYGLAKLPYAEDVVMSRRGGNSKDRTPTLVFNTYRMTGDRLETLLREQDVMVGRIHGGTSAAERHAVVSGIQDGSVEVAILQIDASGSALNLQAANRIIMLEPSWTPGTNHQAVARAVRIGQRNPVLISWPTIRHSIDAAVMRVLRRKQSGLTELWQAPS
jgi:SNF2 family DNA or RNA helicase